MEHNISPVMVYSFLNIRDGSSSWAIDLHRLRFYPTEEIGLLRGGRVAVPSMKIEIQQDEIVAFFAFLLTYGEG